MADIKLRDATALQTVIDKNAALADGARAAGDYDNGTALDLYCSAYLTVQYDTTKAASLGLTRSMARDHAADGIRVVAVGPGPIFTHFHAQRARELGQTEDQYRAAFGADTMMNRPGTPREVANAVLFLASDEASFITGTCLFVDGGQTAL